MVKELQSVSSGGDPGPSTVTEIPDPNAGCIVRVHNIPSQIDEDSLKEVMGHFGKVKRCEVVPGIGQHSPCEAYVMFKLPSQAQQALKADEKLECGGCTLKISPWNSEWPSDTVISKKRSLDNVNSDACWFCLSNVACENHMVAFVSDESYIAIAKGPLHPLHSLVTPIYHYPNAACAPPNVLKDIQRMLDCLFDLCLKNGMGAIVFERYMPMHNPNAMHTQIQVVPVPLDRAMDAFGFVNGSEHFAGSRVEVLSDEFPTSIESLQGRLDSIQRSYFYLQVLGKTPGGTGFVHSHCLWTLGHRGGGRRIPITFGRELVLYLLPDTAWDSVPCSKLEGHSIASSWKQYAIDWRNCVTNKDSETTLSQSLSKSLITLDIK